MLSAAYRSHVDVIDLLLIRGVNINDGIDEDGRIAIQIATEYDHLNAVRILEAAKARAQEEDNR